MIAAIGIIIGMLAILCGCLYALEVITWGDSTPPNRRSHRHRNKR